MSEDYQHQSVTCTVRFYSGGLDMSAASLSSRQRVGLTLSVLGSVQVLVAFFVLPFYSFMLGRQVVGPRTGGELWLQLLLSGPFFLIISLIPGAALLTLCLNTLTVWTALPCRWHRVYVITLISSTAALLFLLLLLRLIAFLAVGSVILLLGYAVMWIGWITLRGIPAQSHVG
jgi:hypothetical protein